MIPQVLKEERVVHHPVHFLPSVSLLLPFEPTVASKSKIEQGIKLAMEKIKVELYSKFPKSVVRPALKRLKAIVSSLEYTSLKKSIAIYLSPFEEKVHYLDIPVKEKVVVNEPFSIRDLMAQKKEDKKYLLLTIDEKGSNIYLGNSEHRSRMVTNLPRYMDAEYVHSAEEHITHKKIINKAFLKQVDNGLSILLKAYALPVIIMASPGIMDEYMRISKNKHQLLEYIPVQDDVIEQKTIKQLMMPYLMNWSEWKVKNVLLQLDHAANQGKLAVGITDVWQMASKKKGKLLIVEKGYNFPVFHNEGDDIENLSEDMHIDDPAHVIDAVDDTIEKVLISGGDVEFVEKGVLKEYLHIALIRN